MTVDEPTKATATFYEWHRSLCAHARSLGGSASTEQQWMHTAYYQGLTPSDAWENFNNNEVRR